MFGSYICPSATARREIVHLQTRQCSNQTCTKFGYCLALGSCTWSLAPWTTKAQDFSGKSLGQTTSFRVRVVLGTTRPKGNTLKMLSWSAWCWMF
uniref:Uncharacterized protein n=1 Tax=Suricata suricatta TaxID=37032 RepID=A0A673V4I6_SURSU